MLPLPPLFKLAPKPAEKLQPCCISFAAIIKQAALVASVCLAETPPGSSLQREQCPALCWGGLGELVVPGGL